MRHRLYAVLLAFTTVLLEGRCASVPSSGDELRSEVLSTDDARIRSRTTGDVRTLSAIYADDYTLVTAEGALRTKKDQISELQAGQLQFRPVEILERTVHLYGHTALVLSHERSRIIRNGEDIGGDFRVTRVYVTRQGRWQLVSTQATRISP
ncbi:MAG TPA: nuclear transport factor 2 family protein [Thermoanaerobaculia bacterium]